MQSSKTLFINNNIKYFNQIFKEFDNQATMFSNYRKKIDMKRYCNFCMNLKKIISKLNKL